MTAAEKLKLAGFLDLAADSLHGAYHRGERNYQFADDPKMEAAASPINADAGQPAPDTSQRFLTQIAADVSVCRACGLCETRSNTVPGEGVEKPTVLVTGEGPGADEDASGRPFVGKAGQLLDRMLASIGLSRETNCFIANVVKCRPPNNREPEPGEIAACAPFLERQIQALRPAFILCAGRVAAQTLLKSGEPIGRLRGSFHTASFNGLSIPLLATYHPSALLRNEDLKRPSWEDLKMLRSKIEGR